MTQEKMGKIFEAMPKIAAAIGVIGKDRKNPQQGYNFRGIDDVYNAAHDALVENGVFCVPEVLEMIREERQTKSGGTLLYTILKVKYTFYASDGSSVVAVTMGEAMDSGDKSCNKAMSAAQKYAFLQVFAVPTAEPKDTENETHEVTPSPKKPAPVHSKEPATEKQIAKIYDRLNEITSHNEKEKAEILRGITLNESTGKYCLLEMIPKITKAQAGFIIGKLDVMFPETQKKTSEETTIPPLTKSKVAKDIEQQVRESDINLDSENPGDDDPFLSGKE